MADLIYRNALRAARELWYDEQNLPELIEGLVQREQRGEVGAVKAMVAGEQGAAIGREH
jgi:hypothetical protein